MSSYTEGSAVYDGTGTSVGTYPPLSECDVRGSVGYDVGNEELD